MPWLDFAAWLGTRGLLLWFAKTLADCKINRIIAAVSPAFCSNFSPVALCQSLFRNSVLLSEQMPRFVGNVRNQK